MIDFETYLRLKKVEVRQVDPPLMEGLLRDATERMQQADLPGMKPKFRFEQAYESIRELADAFLARDGFKTYSHEAALTYFKKLQLISDPELERLDTCRTKRHDSKYYGVNIPEAEYEQLTLFMKEIFSKISAGEARKSMTSSNATKSSSNGHPEMVKHPEQERKTK